MKVFRRIIIVICSILLIPLIMNSIPNGRYFGDYLKSRMKSDNARVIEVNKKWKIDKDTIIIQRIIITNNNTYVRGRYIQSKMGWNFPFNNIELFDDTGKEAMNVSCEDEGKLWGEEGITEYGKIIKGCKEVTLKLQWYDRKMEMKIPCNRSENI